MESLRWPRLVPVALAVLAGAVCLGRPVVAGVSGIPAWDPPPCPSGASSGPPGAGAWYRLDPLLDGTGTLAGQRLTLGVAGAAPRQLEMAPESFASGPVRGLVLAGEDDGTTSHLRLLDPGRGCATAVADEAAVVRSAVLAADGGSIVEHRVDRESRRDLGVWRRTVGGGSERILDGLASSSDVGRVFVTDVLAAADGRLAVSSCGRLSCLVRVLDPVTGSATTIRGTGPAIGVRGGSAIVRAACEGYPCAVESVDLATGARQTLVDDGRAAALGGERDGTLVIDTGAAGVVAIDLATGARSAALSAGGLPVSRGSTATSGAEAPPGTVALAPGGRAGVTGLRVLDPSTGRSADLSEAIR